MTDRRQVVDAFLVKLEATKERGVIGTLIASPPWVGDDSDVPTYECALCGDESPFDLGAMCGHCESYFCDTMSKACLDAHVAKLCGERWG